MWLLWLLWFFLSFIKIACLPLRWLKVSLKFEGWSVVGFTPIEDPKSQKTSHEKRISGILFWEAILQDTLTPVTICPSMMMAGVPMNGSHHIAREVLSWKLESTWDHSPLQGSHNIAIRACHCLCKAHPIGDGFHEPFSTSRCRKHGEDPFDVISVDVL